MNVGALSPGVVFHGRYEVVRVIKSGGMGSVYEVVDRKTRRRRALKLMLPELVRDADLHQRFRLEAVITADVESEHIVETFDADVDPETGAPFLVMELLSGTDLGGLLESGGPLAAPAVVEYLRQTSLALDKTHAAGIVHRDLKPENLFVSRADDGSARLKILDFGIAKVVERGHDAKTTRTLGTPLYMAPEQIRGDGTIGAPADLYALGHIAYALLTGAAYWEPEARATPSAYALLAQVLQGARQAPTVRAAESGVKLPVAFDAWFATATALEPDHRFGGAWRQLEALAEALGVALERRSVVGPAGAPQSLRESTSAAQRAADGAAPTARDGAADDGRGEVPLTPPSAVGAASTPGAAPRAVVTPRDTQDPASLTIPGAPRPARGRWFAAALVAFAVLAGVGWYARPTETRSGATSTPHVVVPDTAASALASTAAVVEAPMAAPVVSPSAPDAGPLMADAGVTPSGQPVARPRAATERPATTAKATAVPADVPSPTLPAPIAPAPTAKPPAYDPTDDR
jgi:serine/threonine-protein kinase